MHGVILSCLQALITRMSFIFLTNTNLWTRMQAQRTCAPTAVKRDVCVCVCLKNSI